MKFNPPSSNRIGLGLLILVLLGALAFVLMRSGPFASTRITVHQVAEGSIAPSLFGIGTVEARRAYLIGPTSAGRVLRVVVDVGDAVKAGQLLAEMDPVDLDERLAALEASIARAASVVAGVQAQRSDALAKQALAAINARRYVDLGRQDFISAGVVEGKLQEQTSANAGLQGAEANLAAARTDIKRLSAELSGLRRQRASLRLLAPADGVVTSRDAEPGSTVVAGQAVVKLIEPSSLWLRVRFDQGRSTGLAAGLRAEIVRRSNPTQPLTGEVARVEALSDSVTEERVAMVAFDPLPEATRAQLSVGELAEVTLALPATGRALLLPNASIKRQADKAGVWKVVDGGLRFAPVRLGLAGLEGQVQVLEGLQPGDLVVEFSEREVGPDSRIKIVDAIATGKP